MKNGVKGKVKKNPENLFKIYFINEDAAINTINGQANLKEKATVIFKNGYNRTTITHELLHCLSLSHIFLDSMDNNKNKKYYLKNMQQII